MTSTAPPTLPGPIPGRVLLTTFSDALANQLQAKLNVLMSNEAKAAERIEVRSLDALALSFYQARFGTAELTTQETIENLIQEAASAEHTNFALTFVASEWERVIDAWQLSTWEDYRDVAVSAGTGVAPHHPLAAVQQVVRLRNVVRVGWRGAHAMD